MPSLFGRRALWAAAALSFGLSLTPWGQLVLYPFKLFTTFVHESSHALMTVALGGHVAAITIEPDTSGLTRSLMPAGRIARGMVASAGYLGASVMGCLLMAATRVKKRARPILWIVGVFMLCASIVWMRNVFGFAVVLAWGAALVALARNQSGNVSQFVLSLLAIQVALNAVYDIRVLLLLNGQPSDAETMARLFLVPAWFWAVAWMITSVAMLGWTIWITRLR
jgi:peptidase M50B-like protein